MKLTMFRLDSLMKRSRLIASTSCLHSLNKKSFAIIVLILVFMSFLVINYLCPDSVCAINLWSAPESYFQRKLNVIKDNLNQYLSSHPLSHYMMSFDDMINAKEFIFNIKGIDVIVFLHIQKTGQYSVLLRKHCLFSPQLTKI